MSAADVLVQARAASVELLIYDGRLASRGPAAPDLRDAIRAHRPGLVALLTGKRMPACPELPPLPADDEHARWRRGDSSNALSTSHLLADFAPFCRSCRRVVAEREVVDIGRGVLLHHACGRALPGAPRLASS